MLYVIRNVYAGDEDTDKARSLALRAKVVPLFIMETARQAREMQHVLRIHTLTD